MLSRCVCVPKRVASCTGNLNTFLELLRILVYFEVCAINTVLLFFVRSLSTSEIPERVFNKTKRTKTLARQLLLKPNLTTPTNRSIDRSMESM